MTKRLVKLVVKQWPIFHVGKHDDLKHSITLFRQSLFVLICNIINCYSFFYNFYGDLC